MNGQTTSIAVCVSAMLTLSGCVPIPIAEEPPFTADIAPSIALGASRADVLFTLGAPNFVHGDDGVFVYAGDEAKMAYVFLIGGAYGGGAAGGGTVEKRFLLVIEFDATGAVRRSEVLELGLGTPSTKGPHYELGFEETVCTSWNLCLRGSGAEIVQESTGT